MPAAMLTVAYNGGMSRRKNPYAVALARKALKARMEKLTPEQRSEIARKAAQARWSKARRAKQPQGASAKG